MSNTILIYVLIAAAISVVLAGFQYLYRSKQKNNSKYGLFFLRFISFFSLLLLLINPKFKKTITTDIKPSLVILADNSKSISKLKQGKTVKEIIATLKSSKALTDKFDIDTFSFSDDIIQTDSLSFKENETNIAKSLQQVAKLYQKNIAPKIIITDGNQTVGSMYSEVPLKSEIYPIIVGDTATYQDIKITQLNVNKYAYLKHKFPVEAFVLYDGNRDHISAKFTLTEGNKTLYTKNVNLTVKNNSAHLSFHLPANTVGFHHYKAMISPLKQEKNTINNVSEFSVEIINEQSKILLVSAIVHPDIAMFKRSIESNKQRKLIVKKPTDSFSLLDYQMVILYQPTPNFNSVFDQIKATRKNYLIITGSKTDWNFLNSSQTYFSKKAINKTEDYLANYNTSYSTFNTEDLGFDSFSPLLDFFGEVKFSIPYETILYQQIGNFTSKLPLLASYEQQGARGAVLFGEHSWRWRMTSYVEKKSFESYDEFINKLIQYLASSKRSNLLEVSNKPYFFANENIRIKAQYYDANYEFDTKAKLWITLINKATKKKLKYPFALQQHNYEVNITDLASGNYSYVVKDDQNKNSASGHFTILSYNTETQFVNANKKELERLAANTNGQSFYPNEVTKLITALTQHKEYVSIQKETHKITPLIDWKWLLGIIALALSLEWFIRKFKGLI